MSQPEPTPNGFLFLDKPVGPTSHDIVAHVRRGFPKGIKVGHAGTLDPLASGLLILGIGKATKQLSKLVGLDKVYEFTITLGATSATDDAEGPIEFISVNHQPTLSDIQNVIAKFLGKQEQTPPMFSAKKIDGERLYALARRGEIVVTRPHSITIFSFDIIDYHYPKLVLRVHTSSGTYVRSLARDIGNALQTGGYVSALRRTAVGPFQVTEAASETAVFLIRPVASILGVLPD